MTHVRSRLGRGLLLMLPTVITVWLLALLFGMINRNVTPAVMRLLRAIGTPYLDLWAARFVVPLVSLLLCATVIYLIGLLAGNLVGRRLVRAVERGILRIPLVKGIYGAARQLLDAFSLSESRAFSKVVLVEYPRPGLWTVGFVTAQRTYPLEPGTEPTAGPVPVFLPTTPNPTSGWLVLVDPRELRVLDVSTEEAVKLIVSGGIVGPEKFSERVRPWSAGDLSKEGGRGPDR